MSGEKSKARTVFIWFVIPWIIFAIAIGYFFMKSREKAPEELGAYINLKTVETEELVALDMKRAVSERVSDNRNMPEYLQGNTDVGVLMVHGFTASPYEMHGLGKYLHETYQYSIYNARVAGHGSEPDNLNLLSYKDWYESLKMGYSVIKNNNKTVYVAGQSMGGLLAMSIGLNNPVDGLILLSPAISIADSKFKAVSVAKHFVKEVKKSNFEEKMSRFYYDVRPMHGLDQLSQLIRYVKPKGGQLEMPTLVVQSLFDDIVDAEAVLQYFEETAQMKDKSIVVLKDNDTIKHVLTNELNPEKERIFDIVGQWLEDRVNV